MNTITDHLWLLELPYKIEYDTFVKKVNGKNKRISYYTVINIEAISDEDCDYYDDIPVTSVYPRRRRFI